MAYNDLLSLGNEIVVSDDRKEKIIFFEDEINSLEKNIFVEANKNLEIVLVDFSRSNLDVKFNIKLDRDASCIFKLATICFDSIKKKFDINVYHDGKHSYSRTNMAGINLGNGNLSFLGSSYIKNGAKGSDTRQEGKITNLSAESKSEVSPALYIKENDVKASHGAALGAYNPNVIFYMMSRGLTLEQSKKLITFGTLIPIIDSLDDQELIEKAKKQVEALDI